MSAASAVSPDRAEIDAGRTAFYRHVLQMLSAAGLPFLVGGAFAFAHYTGIRRDTKDLDLFIRRCDYERIAALLRDAGYPTEMAYSHWLAKAHRDDAYVDLIFGSGNGVSPVDEGWFEHAVDAEILGVPVRITPAEESLFSKAFIMERERYDGADVAHLLHCCAQRFDWHRLRRRFGPHWRVLLSHLVLFGFIYPDERSQLPAWLMDELLDRLRDESCHPAPPTRLCAGTLLSREQYLHDIETHGFDDARDTSASLMTTRDIAEWTEAIPGRQPMEAMMSPTRKKTAGTRETGEPTPPEQPADTKAPAAKQRAAHKPRAPRHIDSPLESLGKAVSAPVRDAADDDEDEKPA